MNKYIAIFLLSFSSLFATEPVQWIHFEQIDSTQLYAREYAHRLLHSPDQWIAIVADSQTNGIGQYNRKWVSSTDGNVYVTFIALFPKNQNLFHITQIASLCVAKTLREFGLDPSIKWANDVMIDGKKISGSLCELLPSEVEGYDCLLAGIGVNVGMEEEEVRTIGRPATSMHIVTGQSFDKDVIIEKISHRLRDHLAELLVGGFSKAHREINQMLLFRDQMINVEIEPGSVVRGKMAGTDEDGALLLQVNEEMMVIQDGRILIEA